MLSKADKRETLMGGKPAVTDTQRGWGVESSAGEFD